MLSSLTCILVMVAFDGSMDWSLQPDSAHAVLINALYFAPTMPRSRREPPNESSLGLIKLSVSRAELERLGLATGALSGLPAKVLQKTTAIKGEG